MNINIPVDKIAGMINNMKINELETLCRLLLNDDGRELLRRKKETEREDIRCNYLNKLDDNDNNEQNELNLSR